MPSSTSSSEPARGGHWLLSGVVTLLVAAGLTLAVERYWRGKDYRPGLLDSPQLWSIQRDRVYDDERIPLVLLGASRIEFSVDMPLLAQLLPRYKPVMLAINAHNPLATLRDLAYDEKFKGVILCDVDARGMTRRYWEMQAAHNTYYRTQWNLSWRVHRLLLNVWQRHAVVANPDFGAAATAKRWLSNGPAPFKGYHVFRRDRSGDIHFDQTDVKALTAHFEQDLNNSLFTKALETPEEWLAPLAEVNDWVRRIQQRGGKVIFYETPTAGTLRKMAQMSYPRSLYWDRFAATTPAATLHYADVPALEAAPLPDQSHSDYRDKPQYTRDLVDALVQRGLLER
ncbi:hypothetical protein [Tahibacter amnicola]|uniref:Uncharacterized protein n=1 Tax=Tahibacter amnicola TaxID=2976241 RepID=A0ABY6BHN9_9GAMM|nr:hypothetical protein [Tahibacter amnicola]UXI69513.1 hypothetical protein N4264_07665 [Tahibacter amnicola]